jgi:hypothetical protein
MEPMTDLDRAIREALQVEPRAQFTARIRARVAGTRIDSAMRVPAFALPAIAGVVVVVAAALWQPAQRSVAEPSRLPSRNPFVMSPAPAVWPAAAARQSFAGARARATAADVLVSPSEMLALQRLFAGVIVAPPALPAAPDELSIPKLEIEPLPPLAGAPEGERQ